MDFLFKNKLIFQAIFNISQKEKLKSLYLVYLYISNLKYLK